MNKGAATVIIWQTSDNVSEAPVSVDIDNKLE